MWSFDDKVDGKGLVFLLQNRRKWIVIQKETYLFEFDFCWPSFKDILILPTGRVGSREIRIGSLSKYISINRKSQIVEFINGGLRINIKHNHLTPL
jgi:hypothetical protein